MEFISEMQGCFNIYKSVSMIHYINRRKNKNLTIISIDAEKAFDTIRHSFKIKQTLSKVSTPGTFLNIMKTIYDKHSQYNNCEKLKNVK